MNKRVNAIPAGMHTITPHLVCRDAADAIDFYVRAFGATESARLAGPNGNLIHAEIRIGDSTLMLVDEYPDWGKVSPLALQGSPVTIHLYVAHVDAVVAQVAAAGATITMPLENTFWGDRYDKLEDPFGHVWSVATHIEDVSPEAIQAAAPKACG